MRIVLFGQAAFGEKVTLTLLEKGHDICAIYVPPEKSDKISSFRDLAHEHHIPFLPTVRLRDPAVYDGYIKYAPALNVMAFVTDIMPVNIINFSSYGTIQYHPSLLPRHRGGSAINWAVIRGEKKTGITIFYPDEGIDTGPILLQKEAEIAPNDTVGSLYSNKLFPLGVAALVECVDLIAQGKAHPVTQDESQATYEGLCTEKEAKIDWTKPATEVYNLIRGTDPQPGGFSRCGGEKLKIFDCELLPDKENYAPGRISRISEGGILVGLHGGNLLVKRVQPEGSPKIPAADFVKAIGLKVGDILY